MTYRISTLWRGMRTVRWATVELKTYSKAERSAAVQQIHRHTGNIVLGELLRER